jgi:AcrR family transcriptional regulator
MRALAARLGVSPNALYSHVANKDALVDDVLDDVLAEVEVPGPDEADPARGLHVLMVSTYDVLLAHPELVPLYLARQGARGPNARRLGHVMLALLARAEVTGDRAQEALRVLIVYAIGFAAFATRAEPGASGSELERNFHAGLRWLLVGIGAGT